MTRLAKTSVSVSAPSRLHLGLVSIGDATTRKFGGAGLMIDQPRTCLTVTNADRFSIFAADPEIGATVRSNVVRWQKHFAPQAMRKSSLADLPIAIEIGAVARHAGFGSGTQLAFATVAAIQTLFDQPLPAADETALAMERGKRSAIGSYGFFQGGFLVDRGLGGEAVAPLDLRVDFPQDWPIVLIKKTDDSRDSISGNIERAAFAKLTPTTQRQADEMASLLQSQIVPGLLSRDFAAFSTGVTEFGRRSGMYYSDIQGGAYADSWAREMVRRVNELGTFAVGQSSWGPTLFAVCQSESAASELVARLVEKNSDQPDDVARCTAAIVHADNRGAIISVT